VSILKVVEPQQLEKIEIRSQMSIHRKRSVPKFQAPKGALGPDTLKGFESTETNGLIITKGDGRIEPLIPSPMPQDAYALDPIIDRDLVRISGITEQQQGLGSSREQTATEANIVNNNSQLRLSDMQSLIEDYMAECARAEAKLMAKYWTEERAIELPGIPGFQKYTGDMIAGDYLFEISVGSALPKDRRALRQDSMFIIDLLVKVKTIIPTINLEPLVKELLELYDVKSIDEIFPKPQEVIPDMSQFQGTLSVGDQLPPGGEPPLPSVQSEPGGLPV
jgi:hypothetical protein